jgi:putative sigma-54 modulation protein
METRIQAIHFNADDKLCDFINKRIDKLNTIYSRIENCNVILRLDKNSKQKNKVVEISLNIPGSHLFAFDQAEDFEMATDLAINKIRQQLIKQTEKNRFWETERSIKAE